MKTFSDLLTALFLLAGSVSFAQVPANNPTNKSTTIVITLDSLTPADAYRKAAQVLLDAGYRLASSDETLYLLQTDWGEKKGFMLYQIQLDVNVRAVPGGAELRLSGQYRTPNNTADTKFMLGGDFSVGKIEKRTNQGKYWAELDKVALAMGGRYGFL